MQFEDKVAVVVGGASGIGRGTALELARRGCDLVLADIHEGRLAETTREVEALGRAALPLRCDVTRDADVESLRDRALERFGRVDLLVNSAGASLLGRPEAIDMDQWQWQLEVNLLGVIRVCKAFMPHMIERRAGTIVNVASVAGLYAYSYDAVPYVTSKFGCVGYTEGLAVYLGRRGIRVSVVCPGLVSTNLGENARIVGVEDPSTFIHFPEHMQRAITGDEAGRIIVEGIAAGRFLILTHPEDEAVLRERRKDLDAAIAEQVAKAPDPFAGR
ncbi:MAG TPA: SDR family oxidoreductase [Myxococcota bacterium]|nr:SDR family oxidoreductase [Myxococcales bacterium]HPG28218.1 SDR family oxidoreductase [Myxococcota bacterium]